MTEVFLDLGGQDSNNIAKKAQANPEQAFILLDPQPTSIDNPPENLLVLAQGVTAKQPLPIGDESIQGAQMNFLFGELQTGIQTRDPYADAVSSYGLVLDEVSRALKPGASLQIMEPESRMEAVQTLIAERPELEVERPPEPTQDTSTRFAALFNELSLLDTENHLTMKPHPMVLEVKKK